MYSNNNKIIAVIALCVAVIGLSVGFAALSTTLTINGSATVTGSSWNIHFKDVSIDTTRADGLTTEPEHGLSNLTSFNNTVQIGTLNVVLRGPGDSVTMNFTVENSGSYSAKLTNLVFPGKQCTSSVEGLCDAIEVKLLNEDDSVVSTADASIAANGGTRAMKLVFNFKSTAQIVASEDTSVFSGPITLTYGQG